MSILYNRTLIYYFLALTHVPITKKFQVTTAPSNNYSYSILNEQSNFSINWIFTPTVQ